MIFKLDVAGEEMKKIQLLDTSIGTSNLGDFIIMECVRKELAPILSENFVYNMPTHLPAFSTFSVWRNSRVVQEYSKCDLKFAGGSNLLVKDLKTHYPQWNIHPFNMRPLEGVILVGVGAGAGEYTNSYTTKIYKKLLNCDYYHSVRDERSKKYMESLGLKALNTGCVTMWMLTPEFCKNIPCDKASRVVFTLTGKPENMPVDLQDQQMVDILKKNYEQVYFWIQGDLDLQYFKRLDNTKDIKIISPSLEEYERLLLEEDLDYVGTRLHGGVYAMRHKKRAIIIAIDERAREINDANNLNCIEKSEIKDRLEEMIQSTFETKISMPYDEIERWKKQFDEFQLV